MDYTTGQIVTWLHKLFRASRVTKQEFSFPCPKCSHFKFYFNIKKQVGFCHRAGCHYSPSVDDLAERIGMRPDQVVVTGYHTIEPETELAPLELPESCVPLVRRMDGRLVSDYPEEVFKIGETRHLTPEDLRCWSVQLDTERERIIVPVYYQGVLRTYVSRAIWWFKGCSDYKRYDYPKGYKTTDNLLGWDEAKKWKTLVLVENTFNAIWLRRYFPCTTNFGSALSRTQIDLLSQSDVLKVHFLWDFGTNPSRYCKRLAGRGMTCTHSELNLARQQPDDYSLNELMALTSVNTFLTHSKTDSDLPIESKS